MKSSFTYTWLLVVYFVLSGTGILRSQVKEGQELIFLSGLDGMQEIAINTGIATTISFPAEITLVTGYGLITRLEDAINFTEKENRVSLVHFQQVAGDTLVLRLVKEGNPCFLTVKSGGKLYLLRCSPADQANLAVVVTDRNLGVRARPVDPVEIGEDRLKYDPMALVGILSRAKQRPFLENVNPALYEGWEERNGLEMRSKSGEAEIVVTTVQRWPEKDAIILNCVVENLSGSVYRFDPRAVVVRVADRVYPAQLADASGTVDPFGKAALDVILMGNTAGGKEHLSVDNEFRIELSPPTKQSWDARMKEQYYLRDEGNVGYGK